MIEVDLIPVAGIVAVTACSGPVTRGFVVAGCTVGINRVNELGIRPVGGVMAFTAHPGVVGDGGRVAGSAVGEAGVVKVCVFPFGALMAVGALARVVSTGRRIVMAGGAGQQVQVREADLSPVLRDVAARALTQVMVPGGIVAAGAVVEPGVIEARFIPGQVLLVTVSAVAAVVPGWLFVAGGAVTKTVMVDLHAEPGVRIMAGGALARVVRQGIAVPVAGLAVHIAGVIELELVPVIHTGMAARALVAIMVISYLGLVAGGAVAGFGVLVVDHRPIRGILVTIHAFAGIVRRSRGGEADQVVHFPCVQVGHIIGGQGIRCFVRMAGGAFLQVLMCKLGRLPAGDAVALGAFTGKVIRINRQVLGAQFVLIQAVAGAAVGGGVHIGPVCVAVQAFQVIMLSGQRELVVIDVVAQEGDGLRRDGAAQAFAHGLGLCFGLRRLQSGVNLLAQRQHGGILRVFSFQGRDHHIGLIKQQRDLVLQGLLLIPAQALHIGQRIHQGLVQLCCGGMHRAWIVRSGQIGQAALNQVHRKSCLLGLA